MSIVLIGFITYSPSPKEISNIARLVEDFLMDYEIKVKDKKKLEQMCKRVVESVAEEKKKVQEQKGKQQVL